MVLNVFVTHADHPDAELIDEEGPNLVVVGSIIVNTSIHFDHEMALEAEKVRYEEGFGVRIVDEERMLPVEFQAEELQRSFLHNAPSAGV